MTGFDKLINLPSRGSHDDHLRTKLLLQVCLRYMRVLL
jgi:hypothetical protein